MHRQRRRAVGVLVLLALLVTGGALLVTGGCDDDDDKEASEFCAARLDVGDRMTELEDFELTSEDEVPEASERVLALIDALRAMLDAAPETISVEADTMASGLDDIEARVENATAVELGNELPDLLAQIGGSGDDAQGEAVAAVNAYAADTCD